MQHDLHRNWHAKAIYLCWKHFQQMPMSHLGLMPWQVWNAPGLLPHSKACGVLWSVKCKIFDLVCCQSVHPSGATGGAKVLLPFFSNAGSELSPLDCALLDVSVHASLTSCSDSAGSLWGRLHCCGIWIRCHALRSGSSSLLSTLTVSALLASAGLADFLLESLTSLPLLMQSGLKVPSRISANMSCKICKGLAIPSRL